MLTRAARSVLYNAAPAKRLSGARRSVLKALAFNCRQCVLLSTQATSDPTQVGPPAATGDAQSRALLVQQTDAVTSEPLVHKLAQQQQKQKQQHVDESAGEQVPAVGSTQELHCRLEERAARVEELQRRLAELDAIVEGVPALIEKAVTPVQESLKGLVEAQISEALVPIRKEHVPLSQIERMLEGASQGVVETRESIKEIQEVLDSRILATELKIQDTIEPVRKAVQDKLGEEQVRAVIAPLEKMLQEKVNADQANEAVTKAIAPFRNDIQSLSSQPTVEQVVAKALEARLPEAVEAAEQLVQAEVALVQDQIASQREKLQSLLENSHDNPVEAAAPTGNFIFLILDIAFQILVGGVVFLTAVGLLYEPLVRPNVPQDKASSK